MWKKLFFVLVLFLLAGFPSFCEMETRSVSGMVTDKQGNALPGAAVQLEDTVNLCVVSYITGKDGRYHFNGLLADKGYTLKAKYRQYWSQRKTLSRFNSSNHPRIVLVIPID
jgi:hypothetical protein